MDALNYRRGLGCQFVMKPGWRINNQYPWAVLTDRLSKEDIERMMRDAEKYKDEDDMHKECIIAKNSLESYAFNMKSTVEDERLKDKISAEDKQKVLDKCNEAVRWIDANQVGNDGPREGLFG